jgi:hypothetical protein
MIFIESRVFTKAAQELLFEDELMELQKWTKNFSKS